MLDEANAEFVNNLITALRYGLYAIGIWGALGALWYIAIGPLFRMLARWYRWWTTFFSSEEAAKRRMKDLGY